MVARRRGPDLAAACILVALAAVIVWESARWPASGFAGDATLVPRVLAALMVATALGLALLAGRGTSEDGGNLAAAIGAIGATAALAALLPILGVIGTGIPYLLALQRFAGAPRVPSLISSIAAPIVLYAVFAKGLNVPLPIGSAWSLLGL